MLNGSVVTGGNLSYKLLTQRSMCIHMQDRNGIDSIYVLCMLYNIITI
jgi:hypothetical protein